MISSQPVRWIAPWKELCDAGAASIDTMLTMIPEPDEEQRALERALVFPEKFLPYLLTVQASMVRNDPVHAGQAVDVLLYGFHPHGECSAEALRPHFNFLVHVAWQIGKAPPGRLPYWEAVRERERRRDGSA